VKHSGLRRKDRKKCCGEKLENHRGRDERGADAEMGIGKLGRGRN